MTSGIRLPDVGMSAVRIGVASWLVLLVLYALKLWARQAQGEPITSAVWMLIVLPLLQAAFVYFIARWNGVFGGCLLCVFVTSVVVKVLEDDLGLIKQWSDQLGNRADLWLGPVVAVALGTTISLAVFAVFWRPVRLNTSRTSATDGRSGHA